MHFYDLIKEMSNDKKIDLFVDMDGVIASYDFGRPLDFKSKRPLTTNINTLKNVSLLNNVNIYILSICRKDFQIKEKQDWLDKYAPFFKNENRIILSKETIANMSSAEMKLKFLREFETNNKKVLVDDDNSILSTISKELKDIILLQDSELVD